MSVTNLVLILGALLSCGGEQDKGLGEDSADQSGGRLDTVTETVTDNGRFHVVLAPNPDPPVVGEAGLAMTVTFASSSEWDGAAVMGAEVTLSGEMPEEYGVKINPEPVVEAQETWGLYVGAWSYPQAGYWELVLRVGASEYSDTVSLGYVVE